VELGTRGVPEAASDKVLKAMGAKTVEDLEVILGGSSEAIDEMKRLFEMAKAWCTVLWQNCCCLYRVFQQKVTLEDASG
jgi:hypothetical protein